MEFRVTNAKCCNNPRALCPNCKAASIAAAANESAPPIRPLSDVLHEKYTKSTQHATPTTRTAATRTLNHHGVPVPRPLSDIFRGAR